MTLLLSIAAIVFSIISVHFINKATKEDCENVEYIVYWIIGVFFMLLTSGIANTIGRPFVLPIFITSIIAAFIYCFFSKDDIN